MLDAERSVQSFFNTAHAAALATAFLAALLAATVAARLRRSALLWCCPHRRCVAAALAVAPTLTNSTQLNSTQLV